MNPDASMTTLAPMATPAPARTRPFGGWAYVIIKGWPIVLRELGWGRDDEH
jgi:hypothetical protein